MEVAAMTPEDAFLSPLADDLFASIAAFGDAKELEMLDVVSGQKKARVAIDSVIDNALRHKQNPGARLALIKGDAGSGKSHVLTTTFKRAASRARDEVYPAILQLTAPVKPEEYEMGCSTPSYASFPRGILLMKTTTARCAVSPDDC